MDLEALVKDLVWDNLVKAALKQLFAAVPLLGWGPIGYVITWAATYFADKLYAFVKMEIQLEAIALRNEGFRKAFDNAGVTLKIIARDHGVNSYEFERKRDEFKKALSVFVRFDVAR